MRSSALVLVTTLAACGGDTSGSPTPDAATGTDATPSDDGMLPPERGFQIVTPAVPIEPGDDVTFCYYFRTPTTGDLAIKRWVSRMTPGSHHVILFLTPAMQKYPGTMSTDQCGFRSSGGSPVWTYAAQTLDAEALLPSDDGNGRPVGQPIKSGQFGFVQVHFMNATDEVIHPRVEINAYAHDEGVQVTPAAPFVTYNLSIDLAPGTPINPTPGMVNGTCDVPMNGDGTTPKFYAMSTHSHRQSVHTFVKDGASMVFDSTRWDLPGARTWTSAPYFSFTSGKLTYQCEYMNPNTYRITEGDSATTEEMCMAIGYYFPARGAGYLCLDSTTYPQ